MIEDKIINEVRKAGEKLAEDADYNIHILFKNLRKKEAERISKKVPEIHKK